MKVLFATTNPAKIKKYAEKLKEKNIEILTIKDLGINLKPEETGKNAIENAYIKAKAYYDETKITTIGMDNNLYIEELPEEKQPGTHVRRVNGKESREYSWSKSYFYLVDKPCEKRNPGYPLDSMSIMPECNKYFVDLTEEDRNKNKENYKEDDVIDFIVNNV